MSNIDVVIQNWLETDKEFQSFFNDALFEMPNSVAAQRFASHIKNRLDEHYGVEDFEVGFDINAKLKIKSVKAEAEATMSVVNNPVIFFD